MRDPATRVLFAILMAVSVACYSGDPEEVDGAVPAEGAAASAARAPGAPPAPGDLAEATYPGIVEQPVTLVAGRWEGEPYEPGSAARPSVQLVREFHLAGDLAGDGAEESVALLVESSGGSGTRLFLAVAGWNGAEVSILGTAPIGDRVQVKSARIAAHQIALEVVQAGPEDAMCCPAERALRRWTLGEEGLVEAPAEISGVLSVADLAGPEWRLARWSWNEPAAAEPEVTLIFEEGRIAGSAGCNRYFAGATDGEMPGDLELSPAGTTRMACPPESMEVESRFLQALATARRYSFMAGRLAISYESGDAMKTLIFAPRERAKD